MTRFYVLIQDTVLTFTFWIQNTVLTFTTHPRHIHVNVPCQYDTFLRFDPRHSPHIHDTFPRMRPANMTPVYVCHVPCTRTMSHIWVSQAILCVCYRFHRTHSRLYPTFTRMCPVGLSLCEMCHIWMWLFTCDCLHVNVPVYKWMCLFTYERVRRTIDGWPRESALSS